jgi:hypothetical protein
MLAMGHILRIGRNSLPERLSRSWIGDGVLRVWLASDRDWLFDEMRLGLGAGGSEPGSMRGRVRA